MCVKTMNWQFEMSNLKLNIVYLYILLFLPDTIFWWQTIWSVAYSISFLLYFDPATVFIINISFYLKKNIETNSAYIVKNMKMHQYPVPLCFDFLTYKHDVRTSHKTCNFKFKQAISWMNFSRFGLWDTRTDSLS